MAKITPIGGLRFFGCGVAESRDPSQCNLGSGGGGRRSRRRRFVMENPIIFHRKNKIVSGNGGFCGKIWSVGKRSGVGRTSDLDEDNEYEVGFERDELSCFRGLVLDISYRPVNVVCWKRAICLKFMEKADVLEYYDQTVSSPQGSFYIPAVLRVPHLLQAMKRRRIKCSLSRKTIFFRDNYTCQYCFSQENLTIDHVLPTSRGGEWKWENLVAACSKCNSKKGHKTTEEANMKLSRIPKAPREVDILAIPLTGAAVRMLQRRKGFPEEWKQYLSKPSP
ncbi:HNH endonuclease [Zostera marina]|uniref:HNH endonuclease n=1 Tax=Zostera marina TaxID=29655 RepID=A0A0K9Q2C7_ZOSMR|nr:HNH endonuclease [Zostera marina]